MGNSRSKGRGRLGFLFWTAFILFVGVIYLANREDITSVLESTRFVEIITTKIKGDDPTVVVERRQEPVPSSEEESGDGSLDETSAPVVTEEDSTAADQAPGTEESTGTESTPDTESVAEGTEEPGEEPAEVETVTAVEQVPEREEPSPALQRKRESRLYYIRVTEDGTIYPQAVTREVYYTDSPMTETLKALLSGPTIDELNMGLLNLIPEGTELRSAWVKDGVAYLNFNEQFRFNPMGVEGFMAQLQQIVFSVTEFSTIEEVQILIEGERVQYLGGEGIYIGEPLGRRHFSS